MNKFFDITQKYIAELNKRPEISNAMTSYNTKYPQYKIDVDVAKCKQSGIDPSTVLTTMQGYYGGMYALTSTPTVSSTVYISSRHRRIVQT